MASQLLRFNGCNGFNGKDCNRMTDRTTLTLIAALGLAACTGGNISGGPGGAAGADSGSHHADGGVPDSPGSLADGAVVPPDTLIQPNWDAFFAKDPPPKYCGPDGGWKAPDLPGGTPDCPGDKNREGCPCTKQGQVAKCWPGKRANRNRGICKDGTTTCTLHGELNLRWGPCKGYVLPTPGATKGAAACKCFSRGQWQIQNLSPCFMTYGTGQMHAVSTYMDGTTARCPPISGPPPKPKPGAPWSQNDLTVDCAGQFSLCLTLKAGDYLKPKSSDCVLAKTCTSTWYAKKNVKQALKELPSWTSSNASCIKSFTTTGGYGEMSVVGKSIECTVIDDKGQALVFQRIKYCPLKCNTNPTLPECKNCGNGASGTF